MIYPNDLNHRYNSLAGAKFGVRERRLEQHRGRVFWPGGAPLDRNQT